MLRHAARVDDLALEVFHSSTVPAIYILFEDSSSELMRAFGIRTCTESPAMLTKRSHMTALRVADYARSWRSKNMKNGASGVPYGSYRNYERRQRQQGRQRQQPKRQQRRRRPYLAQINGRTRLSMPFDGNKARRARVLGSTAQGSVLIPLCFTYNYPTLGKAATCDGDRQTSGRSRYKRRQRQCWMQSDGHARLEQPLYADEARGARILSSMAHRFALISELYTYICSTLGIADGCDEMQPTSWRSQLKILQQAMNERWRYRLRHE
ncbi:hypothetical protein M404DRAFT_35879 [Pisolithus tinctorius Marx 270]|uniref:Uncharacterized protein n=1 Tax=Pisolithus tinctorius Marx 270 TaxID=870435 RepID=A0A0C3I990_PISTI|nr:hypothetical protein M404DRAFT_35879 [Pisolithus tinctorius Marx 270]